jgi:uncharacterized membrane protein YkoI
MPIHTTRPPGRRTLATAMLLVLLSSLTPAQARGGRGDGDHDRAHRAVQAGEVMPLEQVLSHLAKDNPGQVLKIELEREDRQWVYEVKLLQPDGQLVKLLLDARTAEVLRQRRHH